MSLGAVAAIVVVTGVIGFLLMSLLTRRLRRLSIAVREITASRFENELRLEQTDGKGDEIDHLGAAFDSMSRQIRAQLDELKQNDTLRRELVSNISHDLRTPLTTMQGYLDTLSIKGDGLSESEREKYLGIIRNHSRRLGDLIEDLFELSKLDAATLVLRSESFSLSELLQDVVQDFQIEAERRGISLEVETDDGLSEINADIGLIQRVFENLVRNAIAYTPEGGEIRLSVEEQGNHIAVAVADTGQGIPESAIPRIFDRFYRAENGEEARSSSSGLGLAIVKRILDLHGSRITVSSKLGTGTRFEFSLPRLQHAA
jgi:signal transduction histidine kinase